MSELLSQIVLKEPSDTAKKRMELVNFGRRARKFTAEYGVDYSDGYEGLKPDELILLGHRIVHSRNIGEVYRHLAARSSRGRAYYDETVGMQHHETYISLHMTTLSEPMVGTGLDIGAGTGESTLALANAANFVIALDPVEELLAVASSKLAVNDIPHKTIVGDVTRLDQVVPPQFYRYGYLIKRTTILITHRTEKVLRTNLPCPKKGRKVLYTRPH